MIGDASAEVREREKEKRCWGGAEAHVLKR